MKKKSGGHAGRPRAGKRSTIRLLTALCILSLVFLYFYTLAPTSHPVAIPGEEADDVTPALAQEPEALNSQALTPALAQGESKVQGETESKVNRAPVPASPRLTAAPGAGMKVRATQLLGSDPDGDALSLTHFASRTALGGQVALAQGWLFYSPPADATGEDYFGYIVTDDKGAASAGSVSITLTSSSPPAVAAAQVLATEEAVRLRSDGIPGSTYAVEFAEDSNGQVWQGLGTAVANAFGSVEYTDRPPAGAGQRVYRFTMSK